MNRLDLVINWVARAREARYRAEYLASRSLVSASHLRRYFKQAYGRPPQDWLDELRIWHAVELVCAGLTVKEVAAKLDFGGPSHLCHRFRDYHGCTPRDCAMLFQRRIKAAIERGIESDEVLTPWKAAERRLCVRIDAAGLYCARENCKFSNAASVSEPLKCAGNTSSERHRQ